MSQSHIGAAPYFSVSPELLDRLWQAWLDSGAVGAPAEFVAWAKHYLQTSAPVSFTAQGELVVDISSSRFKLLAKQPAQQPSLSQAPQPAVPNPYGQGAIPVLYGDGIGGENMANYTPQQFGVNPVGRDFTQGRPAERLDYPGQYRRES